MKNYCNSTSRRSFLQMSGMGLLSTFISTSSRAQNVTNNKRVVILGFDGVEPKIVDDMIAAGRLPNLAAIGESGTYKRLGTTLPPQSPTAWASFATCTHPGEHGIYDFITRAPESYQPQVGFGHTLIPEFGDEGELVKDPAFFSRRHGRTFWDYADKQGVRAKVLYVPFITPPDKLDNGEVICGLGVEDIRHTNSFSFNITDQITQPVGTAGGAYFPISFNGNVGEASINAVRDYWLMGTGGSGWLPLKIRVAIDRANHTATIQAAQKTVRLAEGQWSDWLDNTFIISPHYSINTVFRFCLMSAGDTFDLYLSCFQYHPEEPYVPFTTPTEYSSELAHRYGLFKTIGWAYDTHAVRQSRLSEDAFLEDLHTSMDWRERLVIDEIRDGNFDLFISAWTATDRVAHLFWRYRDENHPAYDAEGAQKFGGAIEAIYERMDNIVGNVRKELSQEDTLFVISDHGFANYRTGFSINTWLVRNGYATVKRQRNAETASSMQGDLRDFDWPRTKAYCIGLSSLFLNIRGREKNGVVSPDEADALRREIREKLLQVVDPETNKPVFENVYIKDEYHGASANQAADLVLAYKDNYQASKPTFDGAIPPDLFIPTTDKWSGEHSASDPKDVPGVLFCNKELSAETPNIIDLGVTVFDILGKATPEHFEGKSIL